MKDLFKPVDTIVKYSTEKSEPTTLIDVPTLYGVQHEAILSREYLSLKAVDEYDLMLRRISLIKMFENRLVFLTSRSVDILMANLQNLCLAVKDKMDIGSWIYATTSDDVVKYMKENFSELFDPRFFFDPKIDQYTSIYTIAMAISGYIYNQVSVNMYDDIKDKYLKNIHENIVKIFKSFEYSILNDLNTAMTEAKIYGMAGECDIQQQPINAESRVIDTEEPIIYDGILL